MKKKFLLLIMILSFSLGSMAKEVSKVMAEKAAISFYKAYSLSKLSIQIDNLKIQHTYSHTFNGITAFYTVDFAELGYVHIAADDAAYPILGFSPDNNYDSEVEAPNYNSWMLRYSKQIAEIRTKNLKANVDITEAWQQLLPNSNSPKGFILGGKSQNPLLLTTWNQGAMYNAQCPEDQNGPGGKVYAGCVAVAMAQVMYYYRFPKFGTGSSSYYHYSYGLQSANYGATEYKWNEMTNYILPGGNFEIAQLLYHLGVSVDMGYSASGSGASSWDAANALKTYFGYQNSVAVNNKSAYSDNQWANKIVTSIDNGIPLYYHGYDGQYSSGHAFNLDGYQGYQHFHFNWGWGGSYNGYFYLNALNPGSSDFSYGQGAIFNIYPGGSSYPSQCSATVDTLTALNGTLTDGSGSSDYSANNNCRWVIQPNDVIDKIKISFDRFDLETGDTLFIYNGASTSDSVLAKVTGGILPNSIYSTTGTVLFNFVSNNTNQNKGFAISYKSYFPVYCNGMLYFSDSIGLFNDGSGLNDYNNRTNCKWFIEPSNGHPVKLYFDTFDTEQDGDYVKIYDPANTPSVLLAKFSGSSLPPSVYSASGKMMVIFSSNNSLRKQGWSAHYISGPNVGINDEKEKDNYVIYPNPASDILYIKGASANKITEIIIYSIDGKEIIRKEYNHSISGNTLSLDISKLHKALYFVNIISDKTVSVQKISVL